jgi:hypothetical protein
MLFAVFASQGQTEDCVGHDGFAEEKGSSPRSNGRLEEVGGQPEEEGVDRRVQQLWLCFLSWEDEDAAADRWRALRTAAEQRRMERDLRRWELQRRGRRRQTASDLRGWGTTDGEVALTISVASVVLELPGGGWCTWGEDNDGGRR